MCNNSTRNVKHNLTDALVWVFLWQCKNRRAELDIVLHFLHLSFLYLLIGLSQSHTEHKMTFIQEQRRNCFNCPNLNFQLKLLKKVSMGAWAIEGAHFHGEGRIFPVPLACECNAILQLVNANQAAADHERLKSEFKS